LPVSFPVQIIYRIVSYRICAFGPNSTISICYGFVGQQAAQQAAKMLVVAYSLYYNKFTTNLRKWRLACISSRYKACLCVCTQGAGETVAVRRLLKSRSRELLILETETLLRRSSRYSIAFSQYGGVIGTDLRGLYRSTYRDKRGQQRYVSLRRRVCTTLGEPDTICCDWLGKHTVSGSTDVAFCL